MNPQPLPDCLCPHGWRKFEQAQKNAMHRWLRVKNTAKNRRRSHYWGLQMKYWLERIYRDRELFQ